MLIQKKRVAVILTAYYDNSHADVFITKLLEGFVLNGRKYTSTIEIVSMYVDQLPENDISRDMAVKHQVQMYHQIREALLCGGNSFELQGIIIIGEHGKYPRNEAGQVLYPRRIFFKECLDVMLEFNRIVPIYMDKGFAVVKEDIQWMYQQIKQYDLPFMSSSVLAFCPRHPPSTGIPNGAPLSRMFGFVHRDVERYTYHTMEMMQCIAENRSCGETGIKSVRAFRNRDTVERLLSVDWNSIYRSLGEFVNLRDLDSFPFQLSEPVFFEIDYADGLKAGLLFAEPEVRLFASAFQVSEEEAPSCIEFRLQYQKPNIHWAYIALEVEKFIHTSRAPFPVERSLLSTGASAAMMESLYSGEEIETPHLHVHY